MLVGYSFTNANSNKLQKLDISSTSKTTSVKDKELVGAVVIIFVVDGSSATAFPGTINSHFVPPTTGTDTQSPKTKLEKLVKNY